MKYKIIFFVLLFQFVFGVSKINSQTIFAQPTKSLSARSHSIANYKLDSIDEEKLIFKKDSDLIHEGISSFCLELNDENSLLDLTVGGNYIIALSKEIRLSDQSCMTFESIVELSHFGKIIFKHDSSVENLIRSGISNDIRFKSSSFQTILENLTSYSKAFQNFVSVELYFNHEFLKNELNENEWQKLKEIILSDKINYLARNYFFKCAEIGKCKNDSEWLLTQARALIDMEMKNVTVSINQESIPLIKTSLNIIGMYGEVKDIGKLKELITTPTYSISKRAFIQLFNLDKTVTVSYIKGLVNDGSLDKQRERYFKRYLNRKGFKID